jgi:hypothetical protein
VPDADPTTKGGMSAMAKKTAKKKTAAKKTTKKAAKKR